MSHSDIVAYTDGDVDTNRSDNPTLHDIAAARYSRRNMLRSGVSAAAAAVFGGTLLAACDDSVADIFPTVTAGSSGTARSGNVVTLTSTATDNGTITGHAWVQEGGPAVTLINPATATASFLAPSVSTSTTLTFRYSATDNGGQTSTTTTTVTIQPAQLGFTSIPKSLDDVVKVPEGYSVSVLYRLGDPLATGVAAFANNGTDTNYAQRAGDQHDALYYYGLAATGTARDDNSNARGLLVVNHENILEQYLHPNGPTSVGGRRPEGEALKEIEAHGMSVVEVTKGTTGAWSYVQNSPLNRRVTANTTFELAGPARGNALMRTRFSTGGTQGRGTINNCGNGVTGWATNLSGEENWAGYFRRVAGDDLARGGATAKSVISLKRYGIPEGAGGANSWSTVAPADSANTLFARWNCSVDAGAPADGSGDFRNEPNLFGWVVEIDPYDPAKAPRKRTTLGRMAHEGAWLSNLTPGRRPAVYMGDDARGEYIYKFVSATAWAAADATAADRLAVGDKYLDTGTLYVAKFSADGSGEWLPLTFGTGPLTAANATYPFADQADVLANARLAGDALGATKMDRPEWTAVNPRTGEMYVTLTNNNAAGRALASTDAPNPRHYNDPKGASNQFGNPNGHILRLRENGDNSEATRFTWDIYLFAADAADAGANVNLSGLDASNDFSSPDGLWFSRPTNPAGLVNPVLWIQTDDGALTDRTNNQMLAAIPGIVGDGGARTITNTAQNGTTRDQATIVGKAPGTAGLKRFLVGPKGCEITGVDTTPDGRTMFVNVQHPGESGTPTAPSSNWPDTQASGTAPATTRPRSATIVITKNDGGVIGL